VSWFAQSFQHWKKFRAGSGLASFWIMCDGWRVCFLPIQSLITVHVITNLTHGPETAFEETYTLFLKRAVMHFQGNRSGVGLRRKAARHGRAGRASSGKSLLLREGINSGAIVAFAGLNL
jgi:hypothetical protein